MKRWSLDRPELTELAVVRAMIVTLAGAVRLYESAVAP